MSANIKKYGQYLMGLLPLLSGFYFAITRISPGNASNLHLGFVFSFLKHALPELIFFAAIFGLAWLILSFSRPLKRWYQEFKKLENYKIIIFIFLTMSLLFIAINMRTFYYISKARVFHYQHLYASYKYDLYGEIASNLNQLSFDESLLFCDKILKEFPKEQGDIDALKSYLNARKYYAGFFKTAPDEPQDVANGPIDRRQYQKLLTAYAVYPDVSIRKNLADMVQRIDAGLVASAQFYESCQKGDSIAANQLFNQWGQFLFEPQALKTLSPDSEGFRFSTCKMLLANLSKEVYLDRQRKHWMRAGAAELLDWKPEVYNGMEKKKAISLTESEVENLISEPN